MAGEKNAFDAYGDSAGLDALLAAITGEPLPPEARADAAFMAEHRSAAADVALLREQLTLLGDTLAPAAELPAAEAAVRATTPVRRSVPVQQPVPLRERPVVRRLRTVGLGLAAVAAAGALFTGVGWFLTHVPSGADDSAQSSADRGGDEGAKDGDASGSLTDPAPEAGESDLSTANKSALAQPQYLACARLVVEGTVTAVTPVPGTGQNRITLRVTRYHKPDKGPAEAAFVVSRTANPRLAVGDDTLIAVMRDAESPDVRIKGEKAIADVRAEITAALPQARTLTCG